MIIIKGYDNGEEKRNKNYYERFTGSIKADKNSFKRENTAAEPAK
jgi:hypothetical protein